MISAAICWKQPRLLFNWLCIYVIKQKSMILLKKCSVSLSRLLLQGPAQWGNNIICNASGLNVNSMAGQVY